MPSLQALSSERLRGMRRGIEKESLRADTHGALALTPHPATLGSALTHPHITTDFSESQLELITGAHRSVDACLRELRELHQFTYRQLGDELMWVASMPCKLPTDETIPIGRYGSSNVGRAKSVYRMGLSHRYGRRMQAISGIHYNWSLPGLNDAEHFALIRNFRRQSFVLLTLFGASPAVCAGFVEGREHPLLPLGSGNGNGNGTGNGHGTLYLPHATSLRMGRLGYQSEAQASISASFNNFDSYAASLQTAMTQPYGPYEAIGVRNLGGDYNQLNTTLLQIENEFYGTIRPKRTIRAGERPLHALRDRGIEYIEVRLMDLDPFEPLGISAATMRFIDVFLLHCLLSESPPDTSAEIAALGRNQQKTAARGREPGLLLERGAQQITMVDWALEIVAECQALAARLDAVHDCSDYSAALATAEARLRALDTTPSARALQAMQREFDDSFAAFALARSVQVREQLLALPFGDDLAARMAEQARESVHEQQRIEAADTLDFETFRAGYVSAAGLTPAVAA